jgi:hypothetical protein
MNPDHTTLTPAPNIGNKLGFTIRPTPDIAHGVETESGTFVDIKMAGAILDDYSRFRAEREASKNPLRKGDVLSFDVDDKPAGLGQYKTPIYEAIGFRRENTFDVEIGVTEFPRYLSDADFVADRYTIKGTLLDGLRKGEEIEISVPKLAFLNCFVGADGKLGQESLTGYLHNRNVMTTLTKGEPVRITGCTQSDDDSYIANGSIDPVPFEASAEVQSSRFYAGNPKQQFTLTSLFLTVRFTSGPLVDKTATVTLPSRREQHIPAGSHIDLSGVRVFHTGTVLASSFKLSEKKPANG